MPVPFGAIIMAAGKGTRMKADLPKVMLKVAGRPMLAYVIDTAKQVGADPVAVIVGHKREVVEEAFANADVKFALQDQQLGTGHAVACAKEAVGDISRVIVLSGDVPLLPAEQIAKLLDAHEQADAAMTLLTCRLPDAGRYGRIVRNASGAIVANIEAKEATPAQLAIDEINAGVYVFESSFLFPALTGLTNNNAGGILLDRSGGGGGDERPNGGRSGGRRSVERQRGQHGGRTGGVGSSGCGARVTACEPLLALV